MSNQNMCVEDVSLKGASHTIFHLLAEISPIFLKNTVATIFISFDPIMLEFWFSTYIANMSTIYSGDTRTLDRNRTLNEVTMLQ